MVEVKKIKLVTTPKVPYCFPGKIFLLKIKGLKQVSKGKKKRLPLEAVSRTLNKILLYGPLENNQGYQQKLNVIMY